MEVDSSLLHYPISKKAKISSGIHWQKTHSHRSSIQPQHCSTSCSSLTRWHFFFGCVSP